MGWWVYSFSFFPFSFLLLPIGTLMYTPCILGVALGLSSFD